MVLERQSALDFLGFTSLPEATKQATKCPSCKSEGHLIKRNNIRRWYHWFVPLMWKYYTIIDKDPYCDTFQCLTCERTWRTPKKEYCKES